jgi:hypothetical protein
MVEMYFLQKQAAAEGDSDSEEALEEWAKWKRRVV